MAGGAGSLSRNRLCRTPSHAYAGAMHLDAAHRSTTTAGLVTAPIGLGLLVAPQLAGVARVGTSESRAIGVIDVSLAAGLLAGRPRWPWATARAVANVPTAVVFARTGTPVGRVVAGVLCVLTLFDAAAARSLRAADQ